MIDVVPTQRPTDQLARQVAATYQTRSTRRRGEMGTCTTTCDLCGLPDLHRGQGDGIGSCDCVRCDGCGAARSSYLCTCPPEDPWDGWGYLEGDDQ